MKKKIYTVIIATLPKAKVHQQTVTMENRNTNLKYFLNAFTHTGRLPWDGSNHILCSILHVEGTHSCGLILQGQLGKERQDTTQRRLRRPDILLQLLLTGIADPEV